MTKTKTAKKTNHANPIEEAEAVIAELESKCAALIAARAQDDRNMGGVAYRAHAHGDPAANDQLDEYVENVVGEATSKPNPRAGRWRNHRPANAVKTRRSAATPTASLTPITIPFGSLISIGRSPIAKPGDAAANRPFAISTAAKTIAHDAVRNRFRKQLPNFSFELRQNLCQGFLKVRP